MRTGRSAGWSAFVVGLWMTVSAGAESTLTWEDCLRQAAQYNPSLVASLAQMEAAEAGVGVARASQWPQLSAGASADRSHRDGADDEPTGYGASVSAEQSLYSGGKIRASVDAARASLDKTAASTAGSRADLTYDLRAAFVDVLYAQEQVRLMETIERRRQDNLELVDLRYEGGREHLGSLASSQASFFDAQVQLKQARRAVQVNRDILSRTIGCPAFPADTVMVGVLNAVAVPDDLRPEELAPNTPDYTAAFASRRIAEAQQRSARSGYRPSLSLAGSTGRSGDEETFEQDYWSVGLKLSLPLWSGGRTAYELRKADAALKEADANMTETLNRLVRSLAEAQQSMIRSVETVAVQEKYAEAADLRAEIARQQYEDGLMTFENWVVIEDDVISRRKQLLDAQRNAMLTEAAWQRLVGYDAFAGRPDGEGDVQ